jgi:hypothetical protein
MDIQNQQPVVETPITEKKVVHHWIAITAIVVVALIVFVAAWWIFMRNVTPFESAMVPSAELGAPQVLPASDTTASITQSLESIGSDTLDQELQQIEADLNSL